MPVFIYDTNKIIALTIREDGGTNNWNLPMNNNDFNIFKDVQNRVEFVVRNTDRKPVNMLGRTAVINLYDQRTQKMLWSTQLKPIDELKGKMVMIMPPETMADWYLDAYSFNVVVTNTDGSRHMLFVDVNATQRGFFNVMQGPVMDPPPSQEVTWDDFQKVEIQNSNNYQYRYSSALPASMQVHNTSGVQTAAIYLKNFTGWFKIQGSISEGSPIEEDWFDIETDGRIEHHYDHVSGIFNFTFTANLMWVRLWLYNKYDQLDSIELGCPGEITKMLYRN